MNYSYKALKNCTIKIYYHSESNSTKDSGWVHLWLMPKIGIGTDSFTDWSRLIHIRLGQAHPETRPGALTTSVCPPDHLDRMQEFHYNSGCKETP